MSSRPSSSFKATDTRVYVTNNRVPVWDYNSEQIKLDLCNNVVPILVDISNALGSTLLTSLTGPIGISGPVEISGSSFSTVLGSSYLNTFSKIAGTSNGTDNKVILTDSGGRVQTNARMLDATGNSISSTSGSLNVNVTNPIGITGLVGVTGTFSTTIAPGTLIGITGPVGVTGSVSIINFPTLQGVTGTVNVGNFPTTQGITGTVGVTGSVSVSNFPASQGITGTVNVGNFPATQGITGLVGVKGLDPLNPTPTTYEAGVHSNKGLGANIYGYGSGGVWYPVNSTSAGATSIGTAEALCTIGRIVNTTALPVNTRDASLNAIMSAPITVSGNTFVDGRLNTYDSSLNSKFNDLTYTGSLLNVYDMLVETQVTTANVTLSTIEQDISGGVISKGLDDAGTPYAMYTDSNGTQRVEVVPGHQENAKYVFETDAAVIASSSGAGWSIDVRGRPGWYYNAVAVSTLKWYGNNGISTPPSLQHSKMQAVYMVATMDITSLLPKIRVITSASVWEYTLPAASNIINGETYLFYYGNKAINLNPSYHPLQMTLTLISGPGLGTEVISEINVVTTTSGTNGCQFLLHSAGIWNQTLQQRFDTTFDNTRDFRAESNLLSLNYTGTKLQTIDASLNATLTAMNAKQVITSTGSRTNLEPSSYPYGIVAPWAETTTIIVGNTYGVDSIFCYNDANPTATGDIIIQGSVTLPALDPPGVGPNTTWEFLGIITPIVKYSYAGVAIGRWGSTRINVAPFPYLGVRNYSADTLTEVVVSIYSGKPAGVP